METPFEFIECKLARREEFDITDGRHPTYALLYLKEGSFRLRMDGTETVFHAGDCVIFSDDIDFSRSVLTPISFVYLKFRVNTKCSFTLPFTSGRVTFQNQQRFLDNIHAYEATMDSVDARSLYYKQHLLEDILLQIFTEQNPSAAGGFSERAGNPAMCHDAIVCAAVAYIQSHLSEKISIAALCHQAGTNPSTLNFKFRRELGCSTGTYITEERMRLGRRLLAGTSFSVGEIAARCGYDNIYYFSTAFRKQAGLSPTAFRNQYR
ncbi:MAG: helix-turn-helix transcriptional regulator [Clostridia bacterium]|nr:helix-turn-helix transcriptional regulator [Clostridia bacterium]